MRYQSIDRARRIGERGQLLPLVALVAVVVFIFAALAINAGQDYNQSALDQGAVDVAALSGAKLLGSENRSAAPGESDTSVARARETASLSGLTTSSAISCTVTATSGQLDIIYYDQGTAPSSPCATPPSTATVAVEITVPPLPASTIPMKCIVAWHCMAVRATHYFRTSFPTGLSSSTTTIVTSAIAYGTTSPVSSTLEG